MQPLKPFRYDPTRHDAMLARADSIEQQIQDLVKTHPRNEVCIDAETAIALCRIIQTMGKHIKDIHTVTEDSCQTH